MGRAKQKQVKQGKHQKPTDEGWVASLAAKASAEGASRTGSAAIASSKAAAIERRLEKKRRRNDRLIAKSKEKEARRMAREAGLESRKKLRQERHNVQSSSGGKGAPTREMAAGKSRHDVHRHQSRSIPRSSSHSQCLSKLSAEVKRTAEGWNDRNRPRPYTDPSADPKKGKATKQKKYESSNVQPRDRDYGGLGLARQSQFLPLLDPSFIPKFEAEFEEHIPGFFGKQRTKAMKKQLDGGLLWRRLRLQKEKGGAAGKGKKKKGKDDNWEDKKVDGKKLSDMSPDEKVEAMIKLGMI